MRLNKELNPSGSPYQGRVHKFIPYDKRLISKARELRKTPTKAERAFWDILRREPFVKFKFTRQKPIDNFIADFYCSSLRLVVEIDGEIHNFQKTRDIERDSQLKQKFGLNVIRYTNKIVLQNPESVTEGLRRTVLRLP